MIRALAVVVGAAVTGLVLAAAIFMLGVAVYPALRTRSEIASAGS